MGVNYSNTKYHEDVCNTPPKKNFQLLFDPRSPSGGITRTPIQIDSQLLMPPVEIRNKSVTAANSIESNISVENEASHFDSDKENESSGFIDVESTLDSNKILKSPAKNEHEQSSSQSS